MGVLARTPPAMIASPSLLLASLRRPPWPSSGSGALHVLRALGAHATGAKLNVQAVQLHARSERLGHVR
eukprot:4576511-Alexandrium_andersonii.AAC.1